MVRRIDREPHSRWRYLFAAVIAVVMISAAITRARMQIWPLPLRLPSGDQRWAWLFVLIPLMVFPLNAIPKIAALVPRGPRKPGPLVAHARPTVEHDA
jgi:hypothetical protein